MVAKKKGKQKPKQTQRKRRKKPMTATERNAEGQRSSTSQSETLAKMQSETLGKGFEAASSMQKELLQLIEDANREWLARMEQEQKLVSELTARLTASHSAPEAASAYQEWLDRRVKLMSEDSKKFVADWQKFANATMSIFGGGWTGRKS
jgi:hypothetical protein